MVMDFSIVSVETSLLDNAIIINFSKDVDPDSVSPDNIYVMNHDSRAAVPFDIDVDEDFVKIKSKLGFEPNTDYVILIQPGISDLVGASLQDPVLRQVHFNGDVTNVVHIVEPIDFEIVHEVTLKWEEYDKQGKLIPQKSIKDAFEIQIAHENAFYNVICSTTTVAGDINVTLKEPIEEGQYYFRVRARQGKQFGRWSNVGTFIFKKQEEKPAPEPTPAPSQEDKPAKEEPKPERTEGGITIIDFSSNKDALNAPDYRMTTEAGDTDLQFNFDESIDISAMNIVLRRSDV